MVPDIGGGGYAVGESGEICDSADYFEIAKLAEVIRNGYDINGFVLLEEIQDGAVEPPVRLPVEVIL